VKGSTKWLLLGSRKDSASSSLRIGRSGHSHAKAKPSQLCEVPEIVGHDFPISPDQRTRSDAKVRYGDPLARFVQDGGHFPRKERRLPLEGQNPGVNADLLEETDSRLLRSTPAKTAAHLHERVECHVGLTPLFVGRPGEGLPTPDPLNHDFRVDRRRSGAPSSDSSNPTCRCLYAASIPSAHSGSGPKLATKLRKSSTLRGLTRRAGVFLGDFRTGIE